LYCVYAVNGDAIQPASGAHRTPGTAYAAVSRRILQLLMVLSAAVMIVDAVVGDQGLLARQRATRQHAELAAAINRQRTENARLREEVRRLSEDPGAIEEVARRELGLIRRGEKLFIIKDLPPPSHP
jgi:cell division protein FtsB